MAHTEEHTEEPAGVTWWATPPPAAADRSGATGDGEPSRPAPRFLLSPDGTWAASADRSTVRAWDTATGGLRWQSDAEPVGEPPRLLSAPDGTWLAVADQHLTLRDPRTGAVLWRNPGTFVDALVPAPTAAVVIGTADDPDHGAHLDVWDSATGRPRHTWYTTAGLSDTPDIVVAPDGTWAVTRCDDTGHCGGIWVYDMATGRRRTRFETGDRERHQAVVGIAPDSSWVALRGEDSGALLVWHPAEDRAVTVTGPTGEYGNGRRRGPSVPGPPVHAISPDSRWLVVGAAGGAAGGVRLHEAGTGHLRHRLDTAGAVTGAVIAPDATWLATTDGDDGSVSVWEAATGRRLSRIESGTAQPPPVVRAFAAHDNPAEGRLAVAEAGRLTVADPRTGRTTTRHLPGRDRTGAPRLVRHLPDGRLAVIGRHGVHFTSSGL
ncbi:WD40 repeat domain-containing protein [Streptomyces sp. NPDC005805]|uniref:WD40 repeat domain-containing protein n=1 Tax=Streptomyces sp. NPDC005805 TaxID=3157068 RepID=UPI0033D2CED6